MISVDRFLVLNEGLSAKYWAEFRDFIVKRVEPSEQVPTLVDGRWT